MLASTSLACFDKLNPASHLVSLGMLLLESDYHELSLAWPDSLALCQTHLDGVDLMNEKKKHQIMNVHMKWNCLMPNLSSLVKYFHFQACKL